MIGVPAVCLSFLCLITRGIMYSNLIVCNELLCVMNSFLLAMYIQNSICRLHSVTMSLMAFPGKNYPKFPMGKLQLNDTKRKKVNKNHSFHYVSICRLGSMTLLLMAFPGKSNPKFPTGKLRM